MGADCDFFLLLTKMFLPGKCAPETAGQIVADTILNILEEESND
jgi:hypothetical protein